jgi:hypothetical protein
MEGNRPLFDRSDEKSISEDEYKEMLEPYNQYIELAETLQAWCETAEDTLRSKGYSDKHEDTTNMTYEEGLAAIHKPIFMQYKFNNYDLVWIPQALPDDADDETKRADRVLRQIKQLTQIIKSGENFGIANFAIDVGLAVCEAHVGPNINYIDMGKNSYLGAQKGGRNPKKSIAIYHCIGQLKEQYPNADVRSVWRKLIRQIGKNPTVVIDGIDYELSVVYPDVTNTDIDQGRVESCIHQSGRRDGRSVGLSTVRNYFNSI